MLAALLAGTLLGLASAPHCVAMCGPLTAFAAVDARGVASPASTLRYQAGRLVGYGALGALAGGLGRSLTALVPFEAEVVFSLIFALTLALAALRVWPRSQLVQLRVGRPAASARSRIGPIVASLLARLPREPLALGVGSALLPCGVLGSGALLAAGSGGAGHGASVMLGLALGSGVALTVGSLVLGRVDLGKSPRAAMALSIVLAVGALVLLSRPLLVHDGSCHGGHAS